MLEVGMLLLISECRYSFMLKRNAMTACTQPLTLVCRHFALECNDAEIAKLKKQKARSHYNTYTLRQENARLRNERKDPT